MGEELGIVRRVVPVAGRAIVEMMLRGIAKGWSVGPMRVKAAILANLPTLQLAMSA